MLLDTWQGASNPRDSDAPEDWMASTTLAMNPGMPGVLDEGLALASLPGGESVFLRDLFRVHGEFYLGRKHQERQGAELGFLAKLLDSSMRLHIQAHPTADFAQKHLGSKWGKFETYLILGCREGIEPSILLGFQRPPTPAEWRRILLEQDLDAMAACFDPIPVKAGQVWMVPGGLPHALGEGLLVLEVMEPTDWVVRCEHTRGGIVVPPAARYMGRDPDLALQIFDYTPLSANEVDRKYRIEPEVEHQSDDYSCERLIGPMHTDAFETRRYTIHSKATPGTASPARLGLWVVLEGSGRVQSGGMELALHRGVKFVSAAHTPSPAFTSTGETPLLLACCSPGFSGKDFGELL